MGAKHPGVPQSLGILHSLQMLNRQIDKITGFTASVHLLLLHMRLWVDMNLSQ